MHLWWVRYEHFPSRLKGREGRRFSRVRGACGNCTALLRHSFLALRAASCVRRLVITGVSSLLGIFQSLVRDSRSCNASCCLARTSKFWHAVASVLAILSLNSSWTGIRRVPLLLTLWVPSARLGTLAISSLVSWWSGTRLVWCVLCVVCCVVCGVFCVPCDVCSVPCCVLCVS